MKEERKACEESFYDDKNCNHAPSNCAELKKECETFTGKRKKLTFWEKVNNFFEK